MKKWESRSFCGFLRKTGENERFDILSQYFKDMKPSSSYEILAKLIEEGYFRMILTTNFDFMLEESLRKTGLVLNRDYFLCIVGAEKEDVLVKKLEDESMIRIVKLHGDYKAKILPFTDEETFKFKIGLCECLRRLTAKGIIFVGYSGMDRDILSCFSSKGESLWWINPRKVTSDKNIAAKNPGEYRLNERIYRILLNRNSHENFLWGENGESDFFFNKIFMEVIERDIDSFCELSI